MSHSACSTPGNRGVHHRAAAIKGVAIHHLPEVLDPERISPDQVVVELLDRGHDRARSAFERALARPDQPFIGMNPHKDPVPAAAEDTGMVSTFVIFNA